MTLKKLAAGAVAAAGLTAGSIGFASEASAQPIIVGGGLVNVQITDVIDDVTVTVQDIDVSVGAALAIAAGICDVNVNVLAEQFRGGGAECDNITAGDGQSVVISPA